MKTGKGKGEEEELDPYSHYLGDDDDILPFGYHPWIDLFAGKGRNRGGGLTGSHSRWTRAKEIQREYESDQRKQHGEPPRGRYRWETTIYSSKDRGGKRQKSGGLEPSYS